MPTEQINSVLARLRGAAALREAAALTDGELLECFLARRDETAFAALVRRHGPMVLGVCRRLLGHEQDAEDAFQAVFLVLARKGHTIHPRQMVGNWLYGVACHTARKARATAARRFAREKQVTEMRRQQASPADAWEDLQAILDHELERLPDKYRVPIVLCDLEGKTQKEAARQLGWPEGTLSGRLARARRKLAERLSRRGVTLSGAALAAALAQNAAASVPASLLSTTVKAGTTLAAGVIPAKITALAEGVLKAMLLTKLKITVAVLLAVGVAGLALGVAVHQNLAANPPAPPKEKPQAKAEDTPEPEAVGRPATDRHGDPLPPGVLARLGTIRWRHGGRITTVALSPDGKRVASGGYDGTVHLWDAATGKELRRWEDEIFPHYLGAGVVGSVAFSPDGKTLAAARMNRPPCLWDIATGKKIRDFGDKKFRAVGITFAPDGKTIAIVTGDRVSNRRDVLLVETATGREVRRLELPEVKVLRAAFSPDGKTVAACCDDSTIRLWDVASGRLLRTLRGHQAAVYGIFWSADGTVLVSDSRDGTIRLWDVAAGKELRALPFPAEKGFSAHVLLSRDGKTLVSYHSRRRFIRLWDMAGKKVLHELPKDEQKGVTFYPFALSSDGKVLAGTDGDHRVRLWELPTGKPLNKPLGPSSGLCWVAFSPDGKMVATGGQDQKVRLWESATGKPLREIDQVGPSVFTPDGKTLIIHSWADGKIRVWDVTTGKELHQLGTHEWRNYSYPRGDVVAVSPDGQTLATAGTSGLRLWDLRTGKRLREVDDPKTLGPRRQVAFTPDGKGLAVLLEKFTGNGFDPLVRLYDVTTDKPIRDFKGGGNFALSPDGKLLAVADDSKRLVRLWEVATGKELRQFPQDANTRVDTMAFSPDGRTLLCGWQGEKVVRVWEVATGQERRQLLGHQGKITAVTFSRDGTKAASASGDGTVLIWDINAPLRAAPKAALLKPDEFDTLWETLAGSDAAQTYQAMGRLARSPEQAVGLVRKHLRPVLAGDAQRIAGWLHDLDSDTFAVRERATRELEKVGAAAEPALRKALEGEPTVEFRRRVEGLLDKLLDPHRRLQTLRSLELLEHLGTPAARKALQALARGAAGAWLTEEARLAVTRLRRRARSH